MDACDGVDLDQLAPAERRRALEQRLLRRGDLPRPSLRPRVEGFDTIVVPSSSCLGMVAHVYPELARGSGDERLQREVRELAPRVFELSDFIVNRHRVREVGASFHERVTYHLSCHSRCVSRASARPRSSCCGRSTDSSSALHATEECCGLGGTFAVKNADTSLAIVAEKCRAVATTGASICTSLDGSSLTQIGGYLSRQGRQPAHCILPRSSRARMVDER